MNPGNPETPPSPTLGTPRRLVEILLVALKLGLTSFGGPVAHLGYFRQEYVVTRKWLDERSYADLVALCQFLPGPASSQLGIAVGITRGGLLGGVVAWMGFTLPSAALLVLFAYGVTEFDDLVADGWLRGLKIVAVAVVALAVWGMAKNLAPDKQRATIAVISGIALLFWQHPVANIVVIGIAGLVGWRLLREQTEPVDSKVQTVSIGRWLALTCIAVFFVLLIGTPLIRQVVENDWLNVFDGFYRSGSLVFGGGHVILPLLQAEVVPQGWATKDQFIAGYGAAQAVPGPLLTFSAYLGTVNGGWTGGLFALGAIFLPSFLLVIGVSAVLGRPEIEDQLPRHPHGSQRRRRGACWRCPLRPRVDDGHRITGRPSPRSRGLRPPRLLEMAAVARRPALGSRRGRTVADIIALTWRYQFVTTAPQSSMCTHTSRTPVVIPAKAGIH